MYMYFNTALEQIVFFRHVLETALNLASQTKNIKDQSFHHPLPN